MVDQINNTVLETLKDEHIFSVEIKNGKFVLYEECDNYFQHALSPEEFDTLIEELKTLRSKLNG